MRERQPVCIGNGFAERRTTSDVDRSARQPKFGENQGRCVGRIRNTVRAKDSASVKAPEVHLSTLILEARAPAGQVRARQSLRDRVTIDRCALRIESCYPPIRTDPKVAVVIFEDAADCIARQTIALRVDGEGACLRVKLVQPVLGTYPHGSRAIKVHRIYPVVAQGPGPIHVMCVGGELTRRWIETMET